MALTKKSFNLWILAFLAVLWGALAVEAMNLASHWSSLQNLSKHHRELVGLYSVSLPGALVAALIAPAGALLWCVLMVFGGALRLCLPPMILHHAFSWKKPLAAQMLEFIDHFPGIFAFTFGFGLIYGLPLIPFAVLGWLIGHHIRDSKA